MNLKFKRIYNSLKRKKLPHKKNKNTIAKCVKFSNKTGKTTVLLLFFFLNISFSQKNETSFAWLSIFKTDTISTSNSFSDENYESMFYRKIKVPVYEKSSKNKTTFLLKPLINDLGELLNQTRLDDSYSVNDLKGTDMEKSLKEFEKFSFPFSSCISSALAERININSNNPKIVSKDSLLFVQSINDSLVISTKKIFSLMHENSNIAIDKKAYLRFRLLSILIGSYNLYPNDYSWKLNDNKIEPFMNKYNNQFMKFDGTFKLISKMISRFKHFESYESTIKNINKTSVNFIGFDVNILSSLSLEDWNEQTQYIKNILNEQTLEKIKNNLQKGVSGIEIENIFSVLSQRISNIDEISNMYYNLISPNKIVVANHLSNIIDIKKSKLKTVIEVFNAKEGKVNPIKSYTFFTKDTKEIWIYGLKGNDYFDVSGKSNNGQKILLIGGDNSDKYEIQNGKNIVVYDKEIQSFIVQKDKAKLKLSNNKYVTDYNNTKYKHSLNTIKPSFGANPDDGLYLGAINEFKIFGFDQNPYSELHTLSANFYLGTLGVKLNYFFERLNFYKGFNLFGDLGYQSSNYSTNFFGFGNESDYDVNQKLDYNRVRMSIIDVKLGITKQISSQNFSSNIFFESNKIDETPNRFITSETLFFPPDNFFERKYFSGLVVDYFSSNLMFDDFTIAPKLSLKTTVDLQEIKNTNIAVAPSLFVMKPMYDKMITIDATIAYKKVFGNNIPYYQAANLGGDSGLRGYRNQRFTGQSLFYTSSNLKWHLQNVQSNILPIKFGVLGGFDFGRVWQENEDSTKLYTDFGAGVFIQTADLIKAKIQGFKGSEDFRFEIKVAIDF